MGRRFFRFTIVSTVVLCCRLTGQEPAVAEPEVLTPPTVVTLDQSQPEIIEMQVEPPVGPGPIVQSYCEPPSCDSGELEVHELASFGDWLGYNNKQSDLTWIPESNDGFGMVSFESYPHHKLGQSSSIQGEFNFHFLDGPIRTDMPPRLFEFVWGYQCRSQHNSSITSDIKFGVGIYSDFEGSARKGVRFPGHYVMHAKASDQFATVLGVEVLDRDDITLLPVAGFILNSRHTNWELVFPRPKIQWLLDSDTALYVSGELGGNTWAIERATFVNDNATYRDFRVVVGTVDYGKTSGSSLELGYVFNRDLEYRSGIGDYSPDDAFLLRLRVHY